MLRPSIRSLPPLPSALRHVSARSPSFRNRQPEIPLRTGRAYTTAPKASRFTASRDGPSSLETMSDADADPPIAELNRDEVLAFRDALAAELRDDEWYTILTATAASCHFGASSIVTIYELACQLAPQKPGEPEAERCQRIHSRIQETLVKGTVLYGIAASLDTVFPLLSHLREHHPSHLLPTATSAPRRPLESSTLSSLGPRAYDALGSVYQHNLSPIIDGKMGDDMEDLKFLTLQINYGWNLAEYRVLDFKSTELVVLAALVAQNTRNEILWHLRGAMRAGWSRETVVSVREACVRMARRLGRRTGNVPRMDEVREDSNE
ncbi:uncharacterized protein PFL1_01660 [Pseudozyma flocculosa PF-1]|uniref:Carboxymuconolactone decarboxylase-like domain-containing protein n=1 Tax=Pseudozyma flocculosa TaxID=84751 RepID=A0A5C3EXC9_9BASI|nr:uncharacterized protein PFL1_01660 [Pseudozyma flocculosa PF-1]EPQ30759.1 hypothetical protein PFL1_01660 [Pseudozyma flocculosa PF-1]SPO36884.1 uncharacterized protein PSFLO_02355 [Pseudozyma flocculosa]